MTIPIGCYIWIFICHRTFNNVSTEETVSFEAKAWNFVTLRWWHCVDDLRCSMALISFESVSLLLYCLWARNSWLLLNITEYNNTFLLTHPNFGNLFALLLLAHPFAPNLTWQIWSKSFGWEQITQVILYMFMAVIPLLYLPVTSYYTYIVPVKTDKTILYTICKLWWLNDQIKGDCQLEHRMRIHSKMMLACYGGK